MEWKMWLAEHIIEVLSLLVAIAGFGYAGYYLKRINVKQNLSFNNSSNNTVYQMGNVENSSLVKEFKQKTEGKINVFIDHDTSEYKNLETKQLLDKITDYLEKDKPVSTIAEMCLRLARKLNMSEYVRWLEKEVNGFFQDEEGGQGLESKKTTGFEFKPYRRVEAKLYIQFKESMPRDFNLRMFISQPLKEIEFWANQGPPTGTSVMRTAPLKIMVDTLKVSPDEKVPYIIDNSSIHQILVGARIELNKFVEEARKLTIILP